jgi:hypothetical protein
VFDRPSSLTVTAARRHNGSHATRWAARIPSKPGASATARRAANSGSEMARSLEVNTATTFSMVMRTPADTVCATCASGAPGVPSWTQASS